jgi:hypothetical protein
MINKKNTTIEDLRGAYQAVVWDSCDEITNLSDETVGYYAYLLQEALSKVDAYKVIESLKDKSVLISKTLEKVTYPMDELEIIQKTLDVPPIKMDCFELFFRVWHQGVGIPVIVRNGYLLKCLIDAGIQSFDELYKYNAVLIYNRANVNGDICSFVEFEKK